MDQDIDERVVSFVANFWGVPPVEVRRAPSLQSLGIDGDDAVRLFTTFGEQLEVDLDPLWADWDAHFGRDGVTSRDMLYIGALLLLLFMATLAAGGANLPWPPLWGLGATLLIGSAIWRIRFAKRFAPPIPIRIEDLALAAERGRWSQELSVRPPS